MRSHGELGGELNLVRLRHNVWIRVDFLPFYRRTNCNLVLHGRSTASELGVIRSYAQCCVIFQRLEASHLSVIHVNINSSFISVLSEFSVSVIRSANQQIRITMEKHKIDLNLHTPERVNDQNQLIQDNLIRSKFSNSNGVTKKLTKLRLNSITKLILLSTFNFITWWGKMPVFPVFQSFETPFGKLSKHGQTPANSFQTELVIFKTGTGKTFGFWILKSLIIHQVLKT